MLIFNFYIRYYFYKKNFILYLKNDLHMRKVEFTYKNDL
jgi:hypothetical protein